MVGIIDIGLGLILLIAISLWVSKLLQICVYCYKEKKHIGVIVSIVSILYLIPFLFLAVGNIYNVFTVSMNFFVALFLLLTVIGTYYDLSLIRDKRQNKKERVELLNE